jgi:hypothetical protein
MSAWLLIFSVPTFMLGWLAWERAKPLTELDRKLAVVDREISSSAIHQANTQPYDGKE